MTLKVSKPKYKPTVNPPLFHRQHFDFSCFICKYVKYSNILNFCNFYTDRSVRSTFFKDKNIGKIKRNVKTHVFVKKNIKSKKNRL